MSTIVSLPTSWACSPSPANDQEQQLQELAARIAAEVADIIGVEYRPYHGCQMVYYLRCGYEHDMILQAAESTAMAPRPSWPYFKAIMRNCARDGCFTAEAYRERIEAWKAVGSYEDRYSITHPGHDALDQLFAR